MNNETDEKGNVLLLVAALDGDVASAKRYLGAGHNPLSIAVFARTMKPVFH